MKEEIQKSVGLSVPLSCWRAIQGEAARRRMSVSDLLREWMAPHLKRLLAQPAPHSSAPRRIT